MLSEFCKQRGGREHAWRAPHNSGGIYGQHKISFLVLKFTCKIVVIEGKVAITCHRFIIRGKTIVQSMGESKERYRNP